jgi:glutamate dehydrogenase/leucine dehydrogenase
MIQHTNGMLYGTTEIGGGGVRGTCTGCGVFYKLNAGLAPFAALLPDAGIPGARIQVLGQGFTGTTAVKFNGVPASFKVVEDTFLTAIVPAGATSGFVTVTTPTGTLTSYRKFIVR